MQKHANALFLEFSAGHSRFLVQDRARGVRYAICALHWDGRAALVHSIREGGSATPLALGDNGSAGHSVADGMEFVEAGILAFLQLIEVEVSDSQSPRSGTQGSQLLHVAEMRAGGLQRLRELVPGEDDSGHALGCQLRFHGGQDD